MVSVVAVLLASITTAVAGVLGFVGLIGPHLARLFVGSEHKVLIPFSMLMGSFIVLLADTVGRRLLYPHEIPAYIVMAVAGGPFFIFLLLRSGKYYGN
jgi:iron complex transport system permease protein